MDTAVDCAVSCGSDSSCMDHNPEKEIVKPEADEIQLLSSRNKTSDKPSGVKEPETSEGKNGIFSTLHFSSLDQKVALDAERDAEPKESTMVFEEFVRCPVYDKCLDTVENNFKEPSVLSLHKDNFKDDNMYRSDTDTLSTLLSSTDIPSVTATDFEKHDSFADHKGQGEPYLTVSPFPELNICETEMTVAHSSVCANSNSGQEIQGSYQQGVQLDALQDEDHGHIMSLLAQLKISEMDSGGERLADVEYFSSLLDLGQCCASDVRQETALSEELHRNTCEGSPDEKANVCLCSLSEHEVSNPVDISTSLSQFCESQGMLDSHGLLFESDNQNEFVNLLDSRTMASMSAADLGSCQPCTKELRVSAETNYGESESEFGNRGSHTDYRRTEATCMQPVRKDDTCMSPCSPEGPPEPVWMKTPLNSKTSTEELQKETNTSKSLTSYPAIKEVPGPCEKEDLLDGVIFGAKYLGSTQLFSEKNPSTNVRMAQAQEAVDRIKAPEGESQPMTEVDLFISSQRIKVLNADTQEAMMDHLLQTISYIADIENIVVIMARRKQPRKTEGDTSSSVNRRQYKMICHVFQSEDAHMIAQAIGQAFSVAYQLFLQSNGINPSELRPNEYSDVLSNEELYNGDLIHFSKQENCRDIFINKEKGELLGIAIVESGWGSILPTVVIANLMHGGPAERSGELNIGDRIMSINGISLVGLSLATCENIIRDVKYQAEVKLNIVHCPPVTMAIIKRPDTKHQLGFCVEEGIICSLMRGGIAERGGIRVGHRIIEINGQSVVATSHEKIIKILSNATGEIHLKTMPALTYRLLTGQEQPVYL